MLLYGPPGTGKTLSARAIAKESGATFVAIKCSTIMSKWYGETNKTITALFSVARKLAPSIIFLDEVDTLLGSRGTDSPAHNSMLGNMLMEWDGLSGSAPVMVLGTTNRPHDLDKAFLRRMPLMIKTATPDYRGRVDILKKMLRSDQLADDVDVGALALNTPNYSGSDLKEFIRLATSCRARELVEMTRQQMRDKPKDKPKGGKEKLELPPLRPLVMEDFMQALKKSSCTGDEAFDYAEETLLEDSKKRKEVIDRVAKALESLSGGDGSGAGGGGGGGKGGGGIGSLD